jgi:NADPH:quinone reductase-like Zn-dependent oxidoreductase
MVVVGLAGLEFNLWNPISVYKAWKALPRPDIRQMMVRSYGVSAMHLGWILPDIELLSRIWKDLTTFTIKHKIRPVIGAVFNFDDMPQAHRLMESRESTGKVIIKLK